MNKYLKHDPWCIIEEGFHVDKVLASESIFSLGNGHIGQRGTFEEQYSGETMYGSYIAGLYFPEEAERGSWKKGYSETNDKIINAPNWSRIDVRINDDKLDLTEWDVQNFRRILNMHEGYLERSFEAVSYKGHRIQVCVRKFFSMAETEVAAINYTIKSLNFDGRISFLPQIDGNIHNYYTNFDEHFWNILQSKTVERDAAYIWAQTRRVDSQISIGMTYSLLKNSKELEVIPTKIEKGNITGFGVGSDVKEGDTLCLHKYISVMNSKDYPKEELVDRAVAKAREIKQKGWEALFAEHADVWNKKWEQSDVIIDNDIEAQQAIRFAIFHLNQTYKGSDARLNISPKGLTGEKYGGSTRWDTEAVCIPFYLCTAHPEVAKNLLLYRYRHLFKAIQNAEKLGFGSGAALFPAATFNGSEVVNQWELSFEAIYRNGVIAYAIYDYISYTGDEEYLVSNGLEVLIAISRFWAQRVSMSSDKKQYVLLGVTGPNDYENNVNNNWFTNTIAVWTLQYTIQCIEVVKKLNFLAYEDLINKIQFETEETFLWQDIIDNMYFPKSEKLGVFLQQDGFLDKTQIRMKDIPRTELPINQHWTWDRILRSSLIKQADVIHGLYLFEDNLNKDVIRKNFEFYEPLTVHESSLSASIHSLVASFIDDISKAYELYLRTARLDLDDYNKDVADGLHITSMAGTWLSIVRGFAGLRVKQGELHFKPQVPSKWQAYEFNIIFRNNHLNIRIEQNRTRIKNIKGEKIDIYIHDKKHTIASNSEKEIK